MLGETEEKWKYAVEKAIALDPATSEIHEDGSMVLRCPHTGCRWIQDHPVDEAVVMMLPQSAEAFIASQRNEGWTALPDRYDDGGYSGGTLDRPALQRLIRDIEAGRVDTVVCYKIDRLSRSRTDFARLVDVFEGRILNVGHDRLPM